jgi:hypothetical protein
MTMKREIEALAALLDAFGADAARWPAGAEARFAPLLAENAEARRLVAEACALDRLLTRTASAEPSVAPDVAARVADRVLARGTRPVGVAPRASNVVPLPRRTPLAGTPASPAKRPTEWRAVALLAASLLCGLYIGGQGTGDDLLNAAAEVIGVGTFVDSATLALADTSLASLEEEAL